MADDSFDDFYARYARRLLGFVTALYGRADADDIAQEAMTRAWRSYDALDPGRDPWPWLTAIARNVARDRRGGPGAIPLADVPARQPDTVSTVEERQVLRAALGRLSSTDRDVLVLRELHDLTFDELAALTGRSTNTVRQQAFRARQRLRAAYASVGGRAGAFLTGLRWRPWAEAQTAAAAVVVAGALATGAAPPPSGPAPPRQTEVAAGPAARGGATTGPAAGRAAPVRPLQPLRAARVVEPRAADARLVERVRPARRDGRGPAREVPTEVRNRTGYRGGGSRQDAMLPCAAAGLCQMMPGTQ